METNQKKWAVWASEEITPPQIQIRREDTKNQRFYWWQENGEIKTGAGITSLIGQVMPESKFLTNWKLGLGDRWNEVLNDSASYGTLMHTAYLDLVTKGDIEPSILDAMRVISLKNGQGYDQPEKNIYAFLKFIEDYKIEPLIFEGMLACNFHGDNYCMTIDLLCRATVQVKTKVQVEDGVYVRGDKKGQVKYREEVRVEDKKVMMLVDFKSNFFEKDNKSFYDTHHYQLIAGQTAIKKNFGIDVEMICNFSPNAWKKEPTYTLNEWKTESRDWDLFTAYMELARLRGLFKPSGTKFVPKGFKSSSDFKMLSYEDYILEQLAVESEIDVPFIPETTEHE